MEVYEFYTNLEPNHEVRVDEVGRQIVVCPWGFETPWSESANPEEVDCGLCELLHRIDERPDLEMPSCEDGDGDPLISGGWHGPTHRWDEIAPCKPRLRRINVFEVFISVDEGIVADCFEADRRWRQLGGKSFYVIEQWHTGSYNCRNSVGHSRAIAIDFNWQRQGYGPKRTPCPQDPMMERFFDLCWAPLGYGWGGRWRSKCDAMHVSKVPNEGGDGVLYRTWGTHDAPKEDVMKPEQEKRIMDRLTALAEDVVEVRAVLSQPDTGLARRVDDLHGGLFDPTRGLQALVLAQRKTLASIVDLVTAVESGERDAREVVREISETLRRGLGEG